MIKIFLCGLDILILLAFSLRSNFKAFFADHALNLHAPVDPIYSVFTHLHMDVDTNWCRGDLYAG